MEDTKKLIEKYKQELIELSRSSKQSTPIPDKRLNFENTIQSPDVQPAMPQISDEKSEEIKTISDNDFAAEQLPKNVYSSAVSDKPEPRQEVVPQFPYHHEPEMPPPDYSGELLPTNGTELAQQEQNPLPEPPSSDSLPKSTDSIAAEEAVTMPEIQPHPSQSDKTENPPPDNQQNGSKTQPPDYPQPNYDNYEDFEKQNTGRGTMIFQISTAQGALPIENAKCVLTKKFGGIIHEIKALLTNESGKTEPLLLPAPPRSLSQQYETQIQPFALYDATVTRDGFIDVVLKDIPIFDGVQSVQRVSLLPSGESDEVEIIPEVNADAR